MSSRFIRPFMQAASGRRSVEIYNEWAAVIAISAVLQRKVWLISDNSELVPNFMVLLIGRPGAGKSTAIRFASDIVHEIAPNIMFPQSATIQEFIDRLARGGKLEIDGDETFTQSPGAAFLGEVATLIKAKDPHKVDTLTVLCNLWDAEYVFTHATKTVGESKIQRPFFTLIGGATTRNLKEILPPDAFNSGFTARLILVYSDHKISRPPKLRTERTKTSTHFRPPENLVNSLTDIHRLLGEFVYDEEAVAAMTAWHNSNPVEDERFEDYNDRRQVHIQKLAMVYSADRSDEKVIRLPDFTNALNLLTRTEATMSAAAAFLSNNNLQEVIERCNSYIIDNYARAQAKDLLGVPASAVYKMLSRWVSPRDAEEVVKMLKRQDRVLEHGTAQWKFYAPTQES